MAFAVAVAGFVGSMTGVAWAPKNLSVHVIEADCEVENAGSGTFLGSVTMTGFTVENGALTGVATVAGTCTLPAVRVVVPVDTSVLVPVTIQELSCHELELTLGNVSVASVGMTIETAGTQLFVSPGSRADQARFCAAERIAAMRPLTEMLAPLSQLLFR